MIKLIKKIKFWRTKLIVNEIWKQNKKIDVKKGVFANKLISI